METEYNQIVKKENSTWITLFRQVLVAVIIWTSFFVTGLNVGTPTVAILQLRREANSTEVVSNEMASWIASIMSYSAVIGVSFIVLISHFLGRRFLMAFLSISSLISSIIVLNCKTATHLFVTEFIGGITLSGQCGPLLSVMTEYSSPKYRGVFLTIKSASLFWGVWVANAIGIFTHYNYIGAVGIVCSICSFIISVIIPESPYWLATRGKYNECTTAHRWLKGVSDEAELELRTLMERQDNVRNECSSKSLKAYSKACVTAMKQPDTFKPLLLCFLVTSTYSASGKLACTVYSVEMMKKFTNNQSTVYSGVMILDGFTVLGMYIGCGLSRILRRRTLMLTTSITGTVILFLMSIYLYLVKLSVLPKNDYIIIAMLIVYSIAACCGPIILSTSLAAELLPITMRSLCVLIYGLYSLFHLGIFLKCSPYIFNSYGFQGAFLFFGCYSMLLIILMYYYLPETKDRTLKEIADIFKSKPKIEVTQCKLLQPYGKSNHFE